MLLNHNRRISSEELIEHFWTGDNRDPANSLKNMMHKTRVLLNEFFPHIKNAIVTRSGYYEWSSDVHIELDVELFERLYQEANKPAAGKVEDICMEAFELYQADILPGVSMDWLDNINTYYRTVYIGICKLLAVHLLEIRHIARSKTPSCIVVLHVESVGEAESSSTDIRRMERVLLQCLRAGDPFTRLNLGSFALLLPGASPENCEIVMNRVKRSFAHNYPWSRAILRYSIYPLTGK